MNPLAPLLQLPVDILRNYYAALVQAGLVERSLLAAARMERRLNAWERFVLGPLAKSV